MLGPAFINYLKKISLCYIMNQGDECEKNKISFTFLNRCKNEEK